MHLFSHSSAEARLLNLTLEEINKQRAAAGATQTIVPYNQRTAEANAAMQNQPTRSTGSAVTDPAAASMQRLRETQAYFRDNPSQDPTGDLGRQALEGQKSAQGYYSPTNPGNEEYYKQQGQFLQGATTTYRNQADGFASQVNQSVDNDPNSPTYGQAINSDVQMASLAKLQQSAIDRLRKEGKTDEEIKATISDPTYMENIKTTMSNTGLGGTARQSAVLTPAQAQAVLATSRNPKERADAQAAIDAAATQGISRTIEKMVGYGKDGQPIYMTQTNPNYDKEVEAKRQRMAQEQSNSIAVQESADKMKNFTAKIDTTALTETQKQIAGLMESIKNLSPELQSAVLPNLLSLQQSNNESMNMAQQMVNTLPTDVEIESNYGTMENYIMDQSAKYQKLLEKNKDYQLEVADYNKEALEIDKKILEHDAAVSEQKQVQANIENEKKLRRQLNKLGLNTDVQGLNYLNTEIQKGVDNLENLKTGNNLVMLKANLAIGKGYALDVKGILNDYEGKYLEISSKTTEALNSVKNSISLAKSERDKEMRDILQKAIDQKSANDKEARTMILNANFRMMDDVSKQKTLEAQKEKDAIAQIEYLSKNFEPADVADQIRELSKNITSFDASGLAGKTPIGMQLALKKLGKGSGAGNGSFPSAPTPPRAPLITPQSFLDEKLKEYEAEISTSLSPEARKKWLDANKANIAAEYASQSGTPAGAIESSGDARIDETAQLVYSGTIPNVKEAAKQTGLSYVAIARQVEKLQQAGVTGGFTRMNDTQQKTYSKLSAELSKDPTTQFARQVPYKVSVIKASLAEKNGLSDIAAINNFQSGLVDPGATVREGDVALISKQAIAFVQKVKAETWYKRGTEGSIMPEATRQQMLSLIDKMQEASVQAYRQGPYARIISDGKALGVPSQNMLHWGNVEYDDPDFSSSTDQDVSPETDSEFDSLLTSYGY